MREVTINWKVSEEAKKQFQNYCDSVGTKGKDSLGGAMIIWQYLPASIQREAILEASGNPSIDKKFWEAFSRGLEKAILNETYNLKNNKVT